MERHAVNSKVIYFPDKQSNDYDAREEPEEQKSSGILPDILLSLYAVGWGVWMLPYSLLLGSTLLVSAGALGAKAFQGRRRV